MHEHAPSRARPLVQSINLATDLAPRARRIAVRLALGVSFAAMTIVGVAQGQGYPPPVEGPPQQSAPPAEPPQGYPPPQPGGPAEPPQGYPPPAQQPYAQPAPGQGPAMQAPAPGQPAQGPNETQQTLARFGQFFQHPRYGEVWKPTVVGPDWKPYPPCHWIYSQEHGWFYDDNSEWGRIVHHYGRWALDAQSGWVWVPDSEFSPAWVTWQERGNMVGWAPRPPQQDEGLITPAQFDSDARMWWFQPREQVGKACGPGGPPPAPRVQGVVSGGYVQGGVVEGGYVGGYNGWVSGGWVPPLLGGVVVISVCARNPYWCRPNIWRPPGGWRPGRPDWRRPPPPRIVQPPPRLPPAVYRPPNGQRPPQQLPPVVNRPPPINRVPPVVNRVPPGQPPIIRRQQLPNNRFTQPRNFPRQTVRPSVPRATFNRTARPRSTFAPRPRMSAPRMSAPRNNFAPRRMSAPRMSAPRMSAPRASRPAFRPSGGGRRR